MNKTIINKFIMGGKVAILLTKGYGMGWASANPFTDCEKDADIVRLVLDIEVLCSGFSYYEKKYDQFGLLDQESSDKIRSEIKKIRERISEFCKAKYGKSFCTLGVGNLRIEWVEEGIEYYISNYDGFEHLHYGHNHLLDTNNVA